MHLYYIKTQRHKTMTDNALKSEMCTLHQLRRATRSAAKVFDSALADVELKSTQFTLLSALKKCPDITLSQMADILVMDRTTLTRNLKPLTNKGFINIKPGSDRRIKILELTSEGLHIVEEAFPLWKAAQQELVNGLEYKRWSYLINDLAEIVKLTKKE